MKNKVLLALLDELKVAIAKEEQSVKEYEEAPKEASVFRYVALKCNVEKDSGYRNGILEAIDIVKRIKED